MGDSKEPGGAEKGIQGDLRGPDDWAPWQEGHEHMERSLLEVRVRLWTGGQLHMGVTAQLKPSTYPTHTHTYFQ